MTIRPLPVSTTPTSSPSLTGSPGNGPSSFGAVGSCWAVVSGVVASSLLQATAKKAQAKLAKNRGFIVFGLYLVKGKRQTRRLLHKRARTPALLPQLLSGRNWNASDRAHSKEVVVLVHLFDGGGFHFADLFVVLPCGAVGFAPIDDVLRAGRAFPSERRIVALAGVVADVGRRFAGIGEACESR